MKTRSEIREEYPSERCVDLRMREIRADIEKQLADCCQVFRSPHLRLWLRDVYKTMYDGETIIKKDELNISNVEDARRSIVINSYRLRTSSRHIKLS